MAIFWDSSALAVESAKTDQILGFLLFSWSSLEKLGNAFKAIVLMGKIGIIIRTKWIYTWNYTAPGPRAGPPEAQKMLTTPEPL